jgi:hypothetical protein
LNSGASGKHARHGTTANPSSNSSKKLETSKNASGNCSLNGGKDSTTKKIKFEKEDTIIKALAFQPHDRQYQLFPFSYSGKPIPDDMDPMVPF